MGIVELSLLSAGFVNGSSVAKTLVFALVVVGQMFPIFQLLFLCFLPLLLYSFISPTFPTVPQEESARVVRVFTMRRRRPTHLKRSALGKTMYPLFRLSPV